MNRDRIEGQWLRLSGLVKECWGRAAHDEALRARGRRDRWLGAMQISYGIARDTPLLDRRRQLGTTLSGRMRRV